MSNSDSSVLQTLIKFWILKLLVDSHELINVFMSISERFCFEIALVSCPERSINQHNVNIISFL